MRGEIVGEMAILTVDVSADTDMESEYPYEHAISGWRILWSRLRPRAGAVMMPSMAAVLQRAAELASVAMQREALLRGVDLYVRVPAKHIGLLDFDRAPEIIAIGQRTAREAIAAWRNRTAEGAPWN